jgi:hypothetical protein
MNNSEAIKNNDIYGDSGKLKDYVNVTFRVAIGDDGKISRTKLIPTVEERYLGERIHPFADDVRAILESNPQKIDRINKIAGILNTTDDVVIFKQANNELLRLLYGKEYGLRYAGSEFDPELLKL